jgi:hypothetical protein
LGEYHRPANHLNGRQGVNERIMLRELVRRSDMMVILELIYDHWHATVFKELYGFTPLHQTKEGDNPRHRPKSTGWAPMFVPELIALLADTIGKSVKLKYKKFTDEKFCELIAVSIDPHLAKRGNQAEMKKKIATLIRRLSEGRRRKKA